MDAALSEFAPERLRVEARPALQAENVRLIMPSLAHTVVLPQRSMDGRMRVVQNPKCWVQKHQLNLADMGADAPLAQFCHDPIKASTDTGLDGRRRRAVLQVQSDRLWGQLIQAKAKAKAEAEAASSE
jgi:hypothetical protein